MGFPRGLPLPHTAAQRLLDNYGVVATIFDEIRRDYDASTDRRALVHLMLATKAFHHHAASILWSQLGEFGLKPLLDIVARIPTPQGRYGDRYVELTSSPHSMFTCSRPITKHKRCLFNAFLYYASLVREIEIHAIHLCPWRLPYLHSLIEDNLPLLPSLTRLSWNATTAPSNDLLYVLPPTLKALTVLVCAFDAKPEVVKAFRRWCRRLRDKLGVLCPHISNLSVGATAKDSRRHISFPQYFDNLHNLVVQSAVPSGKSK